MDRTSALRRLQRCLRLAASSNPNEAAIALRQARKLMMQYGLAEDDARLGEYRSCDAPTRIRRPDLPLHLVGLAKLVANTFRCELLAGWSSTGSRTVKFVGLRTNAELAAYAFTVLRRQLEADASRHTRRLRKPSRKAEKTVLFAQGWVYAVHAILTPEPLTAEERAEAKRFIELHHGSALVEAKVRDSVKVSKRNIGDVVAGYCAGQKAKLHAGLAAGEPMPEQRQLAYG